MRGAPLQTKEAAEAAHDAMEDRKWRKLVAEHKALEEIVRLVAGTPARDRHVFEEIQRRADALLAKIDNVE